MQAAKKTSLSFKENSIFVEHKQIIYELIDFFSLSAIIFSLDYIANNNRKLTPKENFHKNL